jgi:hypothetical protein
MRRYKRNYTYVKRHLAACSLLPSRLFFLAFGINVVVAVAAQPAGHFKSQIVEVPSKKGATLFDNDERSRSSGSRPNR